MTKSLGKIRLGIVGCGDVTQLRHLPALRQTHGVEVVALADVDAARLESVANQFGVARRYHDYRELIKGGIDAVAVCVPPRLHTEVALAALAAFKHAFIEKPLALSLEECDLLRERAGGDGSLKILVGFNLRWHRLAREARECVRRGELGDIKLVRTVLTSGTRLGGDSEGWRGRRESGGGALFELGSHHFDLIRFVLPGEEFEEVNASSVALDDETLTVNARTSGGAQIVSAFSGGTGENHELEIYGERGWLRVSFFRAEGLERFSTGQYSGSPGARLRKLGQTTLALPAMIRQLMRGGDYVASYAEEWRHFADSILNDRPLESTLDDGRRAVEIALAALTASATGRTVKIGGEAGV